MLYFRTFFTFNFCAMLGQKIFNVIFCHFYTSFLIDTSIVSDFLHTNKCSYSFTSISTGQWSLPVTSLRMSTSLRSGARTSDTTK